MKNVERNSISDKKNNFSVALGLTDYINPILYTVTTITILKNMNGVMTNISYYFYLIGGIISIAFGFIIPTGKVLVGLGKIKFKMPVSLVFTVNSGIFLSGLMLLKTVFNLKFSLLIGILLSVLILLFFIFYKRKKFNTIAVLIGAFGYLLIYLSLITLSFQKQFLLPAILYFLAIMLYVFLCLIGIRADLKDARVHWIIEISNILCQSFVAFGTILLFSM